MRLRNTIACLAVGIFALPARADIIYDNFGDFFPGFFNSWHIPAGQPGYSGQSPIYIPAE